MGEFLSELNRQNLKNESLRRLYHGSGRHGRCGLQPRLRVPHDEEVDEDSGHGAVHGRQEAHHSHADGGMEGMFKKFIMMKMLQELSGQSPKRFRRQADDLDESSEEDGNLMDNNDMSDVGELELGDKLIEKLRCMKEKYEAKVGNETCVMHEMGMLDDDHEIDLQGMLAHMEQMNLNPWLKERLVQDK